MSSTKLISFEVFVDAEGSLDFATTVRSEDVKAETLGEAVGLFKLAAMRIEEGIGCAIRSSPARKPFERGIERGMSRDESNPTMACRVEELS